MFFFLFSLPNSSFKFHTDTYRPQLGLWPRDHAEAISPLVWKFSSRLGRARESIKGSWAPSPLQICVVHEQMVIEPSGKELCSGGSAFQFSDDSVKICHSHTLELTVYLVHSSSPTYLSLDHWGKGNERDRHSFGETIDKLGVRGAFCLRETRKLTFAGITVARRYLCLQGPCAEGPWPLWASRDTCPNMCYFNTLQHHNLLFKDPSSFQNDRLHFPPLFQL